MKEGEQIYKHLGVSSTFLRQFSTTPSKSDHSSRGFRSLTFIYFRPSGAPYFLSRSTCRLKRREVPKKFRLRHVKFRAPSFSRGAEWIDVYGLHGKPSFLSLASSSCHRKLNLLAGLTAKRINRFLVLFFEPALISDRRVGYDLLHKVNDTSSKSRFNLVKLLLFPHFSHERSRQFRLPFFLISSEPSFRSFRTPLSTFESAAIRSQS